MITTIKQSLHELVEINLTVPGFCWRTSTLDATKRCYYTEVSGLICEIDEAVMEDLLTIVPSENPKIQIRESRDGEVCTSITLFLNVHQLEDISTQVQGNRPERAVFPGSFSTIVQDINACSKGLFPHERPEYVTDDVYWFHALDDFARFVAAHCKP